MTTTIKKLQFAEGTSVAEPTDLTISQVIKEFVQYANDAAYESANPGFSDGATYYNTTTNLLRTYRSGAWTNVGYETVAQTITNKTINGANNTITNVSLTTGVMGALPLVNGGTGTAAASANAAFNALSPLTTKGDVQTYSTVNARLGVGANGTVLTADSAEATGLKWGSVLTNPMTTEGDIIIAGPAGVPQRQAGAATAAQSGLVNTTTQTFSGIKNNASMPAFHVNKNASSQGSLNASHVVTWSEAHANTFDQGSVFASNTFTVPTGAEGVYQFNVTMRITRSAGTGSIVGFIRVNSSATRRVAFGTISTFTSGNGNIIAGSAVFKLVAGDTVDVLVDGSATYAVEGDVDSTHFSGVKLH